ncbi:MAG: ATP-binding protein [bacterium]
MRMRLHWRITLAYLALICGLFLAAYIYVHSHLEVLRVEQLQAQLGQETQMMKTLLEERFVKEPFSYQMDAWADRLAPYLGARITIIDREGKVWADSELNGSDLRQAERHGGRPEVQEALSKGLGQSIRYSATQRCRMLYVAVRLEPEAKGPPLGVIRLALPLSALDRLYSQVNGFLLAAFLSALLLGLLFAYILSRFLSQPILEMASVSRRMAEGDFHKKVRGIRGGRELAELGFAINRMAEEISRTIREVTLQRGNLEAILLGMNEGVMVLDRSERIVLMNPSLKESFSLGSPPEGKTLMEALRNAKIQEIVSRAMAQGSQVVREEISFPGPPLRTFLVSAVSTPVEGSPDVVCVFHDITEFRRLETIRRDFVANASHELKTPLSSIKGYAETLLDGALEDQNCARGFVETILRQADHLTRLINDLLDLTRIESGKIELRPILLRLQEVIPQILEPFRPLWESKRLKVEVEVSSSLPSTHTDQGAFRQILSNLIDNAIKFTPPGGQIGVRASIQGEDLQVAVKDSGVGIPSIELPRIFERFYRADANQPRPPESTGLGLAIVKHLVLAQGGQVWAESELGAGSTFYFTLPQDRKA